MDVAAEVTGGVDKTFHQLAQSAPLLIWISDIDKRCTWFNRTWLQFTGRTMDDNWIDSVHPDDLEFCRDGYHTLFDARQPFNMPCRLRRADGAYRRILINGVPRHDEAGEFLGYVGYCTDVTELEGTVEQRSNDLETANRALRESEARYHDLYDFAPDMYVSVDPCTRQVINCNQTLADTLELTKEDIIGRDLFDLYHSDCHEEVKQAFRQFQASGEVDNVELLLKRHDGTPLDVSLRVRAVRNEQGEILYSRSAWRDISEQKRAERLLLEKEAQINHVSRVASLGEMAASLAHELNQPLHTIINYVEGCLARLDQGTIEPEELKEAGGELISEARRASEIIRRLRRLASRAEPELGEVDLNHLIEDTRRLMAGELRRLGVTCLMSLSDNLPIIAADPIQLQQVLINLAQNAAAAQQDCHQPGRWVDIETKMLNPDCVACVVSDNGPGVAKEHFKSIFEPFFTTRENGLGMGLAICRTILQSHGGTIELQPSGEGGASFILTLPIASEAE